MWTFDKFDPGLELGRRLVRVTDADLDAWRALSPGGDPKDVRTLPGGLLVALMMRGYTQILSERPPGNIHAGQDFEWGAPAPKDADLALVLTCVAAEMRNGRRWLSLGATLSSSTGTHLRGTMRMLWAQ